MKFPYLKNGNATICHIDGISKGITSPPNCNEAKNLGLTDCKNVFYKNGCLRHRLGLLTDNTNLIDNSAYSQKIYSTAETTGIEVMIDEKPAKMIVEEIDYDISAYILLAHFISEKGKHLKSAPIYFQRLEDRIFYIPTKVSYFKGTPVSGSGIFALVFLQNRYDLSQKSSRIFEINSQFTGWERIYSPYIPTVYINGRGNHYEKAKGTNQAFEGTPKLLESLNLLEHSFHSYFSTDGFSSSFRLPFSSISEDRVVGRLYYSVSSYVEWIIPKGQNTATQSLYSVSVTMTVNREKGIVSFSVPAGEYAMPLISDRNENNLRITATKSCDYDIDDICSADSYLNHKGKIYLASKGSVFSARESNPLYFPRESVVKLTYKDKKINALAPLGNKIIAFCDDEISSISITDGKALNSVSLLAENDAVFYAADTLNYSVISGNAGCDDNTSVCSDLNRIFWIGRDGLPYCLLATEKILCLSEVPPRSWMTNMWDKCFGIISGNDVMFFKGNNALVLTAEQLPNSQSDSMEAYYWEFPSDLLFLCTYSLGGKPRIVCSSIPMEIMYIATLSENEDIYLKNINGEAVLTTTPINCFFETQNLNFGCENTVKKIDFIALNIDCENASFSVNGRLKKITSKIDLNRKLKLFLGLCNTSSVKLSLETAKAFNLREIDIKYTDLKV